MNEAPVVRSDREQKLVANAADVLRALVSFLGLAESSGLSHDQRDVFALSASRQARSLRNLLKGRLLVVVAREHSEQLQPLKRTFADDREVEVILDRRERERRRTSLTRSWERRRRERRRDTIDEELGRLGVAAARPSGIVIMGPPRAHPSVPAGEAPARRVLIIDDDPGIVQLLTTFFATDKPGYAARVALSGEEGLAALLGERPDVVLLDVRMPGMDGLEVLRKIRHFDHRIPVIMVTSTAYPESAAALANGAFAYIPKPFDFRYIDHLVAAAVEGCSSATD